MKILDPNGATRFLGKSVPNVLIWVMLALSVLIVIKIGNVFANLFKKIKSMLGFDSTDQRDETQATIFNEVKKDVAVQSQMTVTNAGKAQRLEEAMQGFGYDIDTIYEIFKSITGPNQIKAIYVYFGTRTIRNGTIFFGAHTGDLASCLRNRLWGFQLNKDLGKGKTINKILSMI